MAKFGYTSRRQMDPRPGKRYATEYYKQSGRERTRTEQHIVKTIEALWSRASETPDGIEALERPMPGFRRAETKGAYSAIDVMTDLLEQMRSGKDIPSGMLGRWNRLFEGTGREIEMVLESELPPLNPVYEELFSDH